MILGGFGLAVSVENQVDGLQAEIFSEGSQCKVVIVIVIVIVENRVDGHQAQGEIFREGSQCEVIVIVIVFVIFIFIVIA